MNRRASWCVPVLLLLVYLGLASASVTPPGGAYKGCAAEGQGGDKQLNLLKNRAVQAQTPQQMTVAQIRALPVPAGVARVPRERWTSEMLAEVAQHEKQSVFVEGYLVALRQEGPEAPNCGDPRLRDYHLWLVDSPSENKSQSMVVEITPRWGGTNAGWNQKALQKLINQKAKFRITGWLLLDQEHPDQLGKTRSTLWEIHPITRIEVFSGGAWREL